MLYNIIRKTNNGRWFILNDNHFFKPTPLFKKLMILDLIEKDSQITQRTISNSLGIAVSMVNEYLDEYEEKGYIIRKYLSTKSVEYVITKKGIERKKILHISYLNATQKIYKSAKENIIDFLNQIIEKDFKNLLLYGAGEVAEIMLHVINGDRSFPLKAVGIIDDPLKINHFLVNTKIIPLEQINGINHDGILISSYTHNERIYKKLLDVQYDKNKILQFFEL